MFFHPKDRIRRGLLKDFHGLESESHVIDELNVQFLFFFKVFQFYSNQVQFYLTDKNPNHGTLKSFLEIFNEFSSTSKFIEILFGNLTFL